jgi:hypothetical protein
MVQDSDFPGYPHGFVEAVAQFQRLPREPPSLSDDPAGVARDIKNIRASNINNIRVRLWTEQKLFALSCFHMTTRESNQVCMDAWAREFGEDYARLLRWITWSERIAHRTDSDLALARLYSRLVPFIVLRQGALSTCTAELTIGHG